MIEEWTVRVLDENGAPVQDIRAGQLWHRYTFGLDGAYEMRRTNAYGVAAFPRRAYWAPIVFWALRAASVQLNVHGSSGTDGQVSMVLDPRKFEPIRGYETDHCSDAHCTDTPLDSELRLRRIK
jgi:hypothetical protein